MSRNSYESSAADLWKHAVQICDVTKAWNPDITLALLHSGIGPMLAAETLWQSSYDSPYPNQAYINLGREKFNHYGGPFRPGSWGGLWGFMRVGFQPITFSHGFPNRNTG